MEYYSPGTTNKMKFVALLCLVSFAAAIPFGEMGQLYNYERIVQGEHVEKGEFPFQVSLQKTYQPSHFCGGVIYNKRYIITAAHCLSSESYSSFIVRIGTNAHNSGGETYSLEKLIIHPNYDSWTMDYDIALLKTNKEMKLSPISSMNSIPILGNNVNLKNKDVIASGWGYTRENGCTLPTDLMMVQLPVVDDISCNRTYQGQITDRMFCAGYAAGNKGICQGDSGGPVTFVDGGVRKLAGIISWGYGCARPGYPAIFVNIQALRTWIQENAV